MIVQLYPDMGLAAMLKNQWGDADFAIGSLGDRTPFQEEDDIIIFAAPDPQGATRLETVNIFARCARPTCIPDIKD